MKLSKIFRVKSILALPVLLGSLQVAAQISEIRNGNPATSKQFQGVAVLANLTIEPGSAIYMRHACTVSLVSPTRVMTATHCIASEFGSNRQNDTRYVLFTKDNKHPYHIINNGDFNSIEEIEKAGIIVRKIEAKHHIFPPQFKPGTNTRLTRKWNDIMFLKISPKVDSIKPLRIANSATVRKIKSGDKLTPVGFGYKTWDFFSLLGTLPEVLQQADLYVRTNRQCQPMSSSRFIPNHSICTVPMQSQPEKRALACPGDSGAPVTIYNTQMKRHEIVGVHSWGSATSEPDTCGEREINVSTKPTAFAAWVDSVSKTGYSIK